MEPLFLLLFHSLDFIPLQLLQTNFFLLISNHLLSQKLLFHQHFRYFFFLFCFQYFESLSSIFSPFHIQFSVFCNLNLLYLLSLSSSIRKNLNPSFTLTSKCQYFRCFFFSQVNFFSCALFFLLDECNTIPVRIITLIAICGLSEGFKTYIRSCASFAAFFLICLKTFNFRFMFISSSSRREESIIFVFLTAVVVGGFNFGVGQADYRYNYSLLINFDISTL